MTLERISDHPIEPIFLNRWSPRAYDATSMPVSDLLTILEAARWAPSAYNVQPWRFLYFHRDDAHWQTYLALLDPFTAGLSRLQRLSWFCQIPSCQAMAIIHKSHLALTVLTRVRLGRSWPFKQRHWGIRPTRWRASILNK